jgi:hypothetical protein
MVGPPPLDASETLWHDAGTGLAEVSRDVKCLLLVRSGAAATKKRGKKAAAKHAPKTPETKDLLS